MSDIVERLREQAELVPVVPRAPWKAMAEAADEITSLRAQVAALEGDAGRYRWLRGELTIERGTYSEGKHVAWWPCLGVQSGLDKHIDAAIDAERGKA